MSMSEIQSKLKAPKGQFNNFGKYNYRSCEDIVEAAKPVLKEFGYYLLLTDDVLEVGGRVYVRATVSVMNGDTVIASANAFAREADQKKGMDESQITGTASSYARKYALNGLFAIDDTKDADTDEHKNQAANAPAQAPIDDKPWYNDFEKHKTTMAQKIASGESAPKDIVATLRTKFKVSKEVEQKINSLAQQEQPA